MTPEKQRIAIAEACGWKHEFNGDHEDPEWYWIPPNDPDGYGKPPNYLNDLNAMHEAEKVLTTEQRHDYVRALCSITDAWPMMPDFSTTFATAAQKAEALLKTLNKWEETA